MWLQKMLEKHIAGRTAEERSRENAHPPAQQAGTAQTQNECVKAEDMRNFLIGQICRGRLCVPEGVQEIRAGLLERCEQLESVVVPGTVRKIGSRAFAVCENLREAVLQEGVETIESNAFTGCRQLRSVRLPSSILEFNGWSFYHSGLTEPLFSADGRVLVYYPQMSDETEYTVPEGVEEIGSRAFIKISHLTRLHLPESLKRINKRAFIDCGFSELRIPAGVEIAENAFTHFSNGLKIQREERRTALEERMDQYRWQGISFLCSRRLRLPADKHWKDEDFCKLALRCSDGDVSAMDEMCGYFRAKACGAGDEPFYRCAEQFWQVRAYLHGSERARQYLETWVKENPDSRMVSPDINENLCGTAYGEVLNALGFLFFKGGEEYSLSGIDKDGIVEVSSYESEDGPDEDGFGREDYYDWWYLDSCLNLPEGAGYIHSYSHHDKRCNEKRFRDLHDRAAALSKRGNV